MIDINKEIESLNWDKEPKGLYEPIAYALASGGKRVRPTLALLAAETIINGGLLNGNVMDDVIPAALALEVFHNFTLLHDDVMECMSNGTRTRLSSQATRCSSRRTSYWHKCRQRK